MNAKAPEDMQLHIRFIDNQHKKIYEQIYRIVTLVRQGRPVTEVRYEIEDLQRIIDIHHKAEERYMKQYHFGEFEEHAREHQVFVKNMDILKTLYLKNGNSEKLIEIVEMQFEEWKRTHVLEYDMRLADFLRTNKLAG